MKFKPNIIRFPSDQYEFVNENVNYWMGPCADSFCYASCDSPHCKQNLRLGKNPQEHNNRLRIMQAEELNALLDRLGIDTEV